MELQSRTERINPIDCLEEMIRRSSSQEKERLKLQKLLCCLKLGKKL